MWQTKSPQNYIEFTFTGKTAGSSELYEIITAALSQLPFESFMEECGSLKAYIEESAFSEEDFGRMFIWELPLEFDYSKKIIARQNWNAQWEANFEPIETEGLTVRAPFHKKPASGLDIIIEPRMAFGTGHHQTTQLMMRLLLDENLEGKSLCDMGTGTGVLAIIAEKRGAKQVLALDTDQWAVDNAMDNLALNSSKNIKVFQGSAELTEGAKFDVFLANINRNIILGNLPAYVQSLGAGGIMLLSGFFEADCPIITEAAERFGMSPSGLITKDEWAAIRLTKETK